MAQLLSHLLEQLRNLRRRGFPLPQIPDGPPGFIHRGADLIARGVEQVPERSRTIRIEGNHSFQEGGSTDAPLNHRVVHFTRNAVALFKYGVESLVYLPQPETIHQEDSGECESRT